MQLTFSRTPCSLERAMQAKMTVNPKIFEPNNPPTVRLSSPIAEASIAVIRSVAPFENARRVEPATACSSLRMADRVSIAEER